MAETQTNSALVVKQWDDKFFKEYVRDSRFKRYMGTDENSVIQVREDLTKKKGDQITIPLVTRLTGSGVTGNAVLEGNEEQLDNYGWAIPVDVHRNAVIVTEWEEQKSAIDLRNAARMQLKLWAMERLRGGTGASSKFGIIDNMAAVYDGSTYALYADASEAVKDAWVANNDDRILFGNAKSNNSSNDHSASLANVDTTNDTLDSGIVSLAKRMAKTADPHIRPIRTNEDEEWYVMFANSLAFRDLKADTVITQANREGWQRYGGSAKTGGEGGNPLFRDGDLVYDGVIIREVPEIAVISGVGASSADVAPNYLCGAQALANVWAQRTASRVNQQGGSDYGFRFGVGCQEIRGCRKNFFNDIQHGMVTVYTAGAADS